MIAINLSTPSRWPILAILLLSLVLNAVPLWWGLPSDGDKTWSFDEIPPSDLGLTARSRHSGRYPPLHYTILRAVYAPARAVAARGLIDLDKSELRTVLQIIGRLLSVMLATLTVFLVYRIALKLGSSRWACLAALVAALMAPFVFYAKTINLEAPYVFWFALSLLFFACLQLTHKLGDYLGFAAAMTLSVCTKDQAFALYVLAPLVLFVDLHHFSYPGRLSLRTLGGTLFDRRLIGGALLSVALFVLIHDLIFGWGDFRFHLRVIMGRGSKPAQMFEPSMAGHIQMFLQAARHLAFSMGWPMLIAALAGIVVAIKRRSRILLSLLVFPISYYLFFFVPILYHRVRFFVPVCVVLAFFAALALNRLLELRRPLSWLGRLLVAAAMVFTFLRAASLDQEMLFDTRYMVEEWVQQEGDRTDRVVVVGTFQQRLPRRLPMRKLAAASEKGIFALRRWGAEFLVVNELEAQNRKQKEFMRRLLGGELNYEVESRLHHEPWPFRLDRQGVSTNLTTVNPPMIILRQSAAWGLSEDEISTALAELADGGTGPDWAEVAESIVSSPALRERTSAGKSTIAWGLYSDGWSHGSRPVGVVVANNTRREVRPTLRLRCNAPQETYPVTAKVQQEMGTTTVVFEQRGAQLIVLASLFAGQSRLIVVASDREWSPTETDRRRLGVQVRRGPDRRP